MGASAGAGRAGLALALFLAAAVVPAQQPSPSPSPSPAPSPSLTVMEMAEQVIDALEAVAEDPCRKAQEEGLPCFPATSTAVQGPRVSVRESLGLKLPEEQWSPGRPPTEKELKTFRPGPQGEVVNLVAFDPGCVGKSALKSLKGRSDTYWVYRLRDAQGERLALLDRPLDAAHFQGHVEQVGRFDGECEAVAAYRHELRRMRAAREPTIEVVPPATSPAPKP